MPLSPSSTSAAVIAICTWGSVEPCTGIASYEPTPHDMVVRAVGEIHSIGGDPAAAGTAGRGSRGIIYGDGEVLQTEVRGIRDLEGDEAWGIGAVATAFYIGGSAADGRSAGLRGLSPACIRIKAPLNRDIAGYSSDRMVEDIGARGHLDDGIGAGGATQGF